MAETVEIPVARNVPVLTEGTAEVTSDTSEGQYRARWVEVVERLFLNGVKHQTGDSPIGTEPEGLIFCKTKKTSAALSVLEPALMGAEFATDSSVRIEAPVAGGEKRMAHCKRRVWISLMSLRSIAKRIDPPPTSFLRIIFEEPTFSMIPNTLWPS